MRRLCREADLAVRRGGEALVVACAHIDLAEAATVAERLRSAAAAEAWSQITAGLQVSINFGVATVLALPPTAGRWAHFTLVDRRLYAASL